MTAGQRIHATASGLLLVTEDAKETPKTIEQYRCRCPRCGKDEFIGRSARVECTACGWEGDRDERAFNRGYVEVSDEDNNRQRTETALRVLWGTLGLREYHKPREQTTELGYVKDMMAEREAFWNEMATKLLGYGIPEKSDR